MSPLSLAPKQAFNRALPDSPACDRSLSQGTVSAWIRQGRPSSNAPVGHSLPAADHVAQVGTRREHAHYRMVNVREHLVRHWRTPTREAVLMTLALAGERLDGGVLVM
jgi:hypothetical protein